MAPTAELPAYNYEHFDFAGETPELERWLREGARAGSNAPDFELADLDGRRVRLSRLRGRPVVVEFGAYTCSIFSDRVPAMEELARARPDAAFLVVAVREAHPGELRPAHASAADKRSAAARLAAVETIGRRVLVDDLAGSTHRAYGGAWNPVYVVAADGRVAMRLAWNHPQRVAAALDALAEDRLPDPGESIKMAPLPGRAPFGLRLLERGGVAALLDFYLTAPPPVRRSLESSASAEVRRIVVEAGGGEGLAG